MQFILPIYYIAVMIMMLIIESWRHLKFSWAFDCVAKKWKIIIRFNEEIMVYFPFDYFALAVPILLTVPFWDGWIIPYPWESSEILYTQRSASQIGLSAHRIGLKLFSWCRGLYLVRDAEGLYMAWTLKTFPGPPRHYHNPMRSTLSSLLVGLLT